MKTSQRAGFVVAFPLEAKRRIARIKSQLITVWVRRVPNPGLDFHMHYSKIGIMTFYGYQGIL